MREESSFRSRSGDRLRARCDDGNNVGHCVNRSSGPTYGECLAARVTSLQATSRLSSSRRPRVDLEAAYGDCAPYDPDASACRASPTRSRRPLAASASCSKTSMGRARHRRGRQALAVPGLPCGTRAVDPDRMRRRTTARRTPRSTPE